MCYFVCSKLTSEDLWSSAFKKIGIGKNWDKDWGPIVLMWESDCMYIVAGWLYETDITHCIKQERTFLSVVQEPNLGLGHFIFEFPQSHTHTHTHTPGGTPLNEWSVRREGRCLYKIQYTYETNIHALSGIRIRTCESSNQAGSDLSLRASTGFGRICCYRTIYDVIIGADVFKAALWLCWGSVVVKALRY